MSSVFGGKSLTGAAGGVDAGVSGLTTADGGNAIADNEVIRGDGTTGIQGSDITIADVAGASVAVATTAGNALAVSATAPTATTGASQAGKNVSVTASAATASTDTAGAAAGGAVTVTGGAAARLTSGNANGGAVNLIPGAGIGTGVQGSIRLGGTTYSAGAFYPEVFVDKDATNVAGAQIRQAGGSDSSFTDISARSLLSVSGSNASVRSAIMTGTGVAVADGAQFSFSSSSTNATGTKDGGFVRSAAGVVRLTNGSTGIGSLLASVLVEANTAGSGAPNVLTANESRTVLTNEGATAANYHTLPTAAAGYAFEFIVQDADGIRVVANTADTIRVIDKVTAAAGYIESTTIGSVVRLVAINATEWYATSVHGVWTDGTWTYDDTGNTSP